MNTILDETTSLEKAAEILKAISHPIRLSIIKELSDSERLSVTEIHEFLNIEQAAASHHLGILRDKGVLTAKREGKSIFYSLKYNSISKVVSWISDYV